MTALVHMPRWMDSGVGGCATPKTEYERDKLANLQVYRSRTESCFSANADNVCKSGNKKEGSLEKLRQRKKKNHSCFRQQFEAEKESMRNSLLIVQLSLSASASEGFRERERGSLCTVMIIKASGISLSVCVCVKKHTRVKREERVCFWSCLVCVFLSVLLLRHPPVWKINNDQLLL